MLLTCFLLVLLFFVYFPKCHSAIIKSEKTYPAKSGMREWVDIDTPQSAYTVTTSRGQKWDLVMSDEFEMPGRDFSAGHDHMWTSLDLPDGVNAALEYYSPNMTTTVFDKNQNLGYYQIKVQPETINLTIYNQYTLPPSWQNITMGYRGGMTQSWNKFCFQGGRLEVRAILPGAVSSKSGNPDLAGAKSNVAKANAFYPTWPGIWMMGNLGRALFTGSTGRVWPWSYNECRPEYATQQKFSACDSNPGFGLNPRQGRGAPEIDLFEGGGVAISSSVQIAPGMPSEYRMLPPQTTTGVNGSKPDAFFCSYGGNCNTPGANIAGIPTSVYKSIRPTWNTWYQGMRYTSNKFCVENGDIQTYDAITTAIKTGITSNKFDSSSVPASQDVYGDFSFVDYGLPKSSNTEHWGIKSTPNCYSVQNPYKGSFLCDPDNTDTQCPTPRNSTTKAYNEMKAFNYQMDALSANWNVHVGVYTDWTIYQLEWVPGSDGYIRWMIFDSVIFEIPASSIENVPQNGNVYNPKKLMIEEPLYLIMNVALSSSWGASPRDKDHQITFCTNLSPSDTRTRAICDDYPMYLKVDYIRLYQEMETMSIGCDPASHPTAKYIDSHMREYTDHLNPHIPVAGLGFCSKDDDCSSGIVSTGLCVKKRCKCTQSNAWSGPRCTRPASQNSSSGRSRAPPFALLFSMTLVAIILALWIIVRTQLHLKTCGEVLGWLKGKGSKNKKPLGATPTVETRNTSDLTFNNSLKQRLVDETGMGPGSMVRGSQQSVMNSPIRLSDRLSTQPRPSQQQLAPAVASVALYQNFTPSGNNNNLSSELSDPPNRTSQLNSFAPSSRSSERSDPIVIQNSTTREPSLFAARPSQSMAADSAELPRSSTHIENSNDPSANYASHLNPSSLSTRSSERSNPGVAQNNLSAEPSLYVARPSTGPMTGVVPPSNSLESSHNTSGDQQISSTVTSQSIPNAATTSISETLGNTSTGPAREPSLLAGRHSQSVSPEISIGLSESSNSIEQPNSNSSSVDLSTSSLRSQSHLSGDSNRISQHSSAIGVGISNPSRNTTSSASEDTTNNLRQSYGTSDPNRNTTASQPVVETDDSGSAPLLSNSSPSS